MLRTALLFAFCASVVAALPAHAANVATLPCLEKGLKAPARKLLLDDLQKNLVNAGGAQNYRPETVTAVQAVGRACQKKYGWSDAAVSAAILYTMSKIGWPLADKYARTKGLNPTKLKKRFDSLPPAERNDAVNETVLGKLARGSLEAKELDGSNAALAGALFGLLGLNAKGLADFKAS